jgi:Domain of Unknown Function (DUF1080)
MRVYRILHRWSWFVRTPASSLTPPLKQRPVHLASLVCFMLVSLVACSTGPSTTSTQTPTSIPATRQASPTPTPWPAGIVLYQANWSHGLSGWQGTRGWKVVQGQLETVASGPSVLTIPYQLPVSDYAIEARIQVVGLLQQNGGYFSIFATKAPGKDGYQAGVSNLEGSEPRPNGAHPQAQVILDPFGDMMQGTGLPVDFEPGSNWHTYRVEVQGSDVRLLVDGVQEGGSGSSDQTDLLSNGPVGLISSLLILRVSSFRILTL